jgi:hypothetical protein
MASFERPPEVLPDYMGRKKVLKVVPGPRGVVLERAVTLAANQSHYLRVGVTHHPTLVWEQTGEPEIGSWLLEVQVDGKKIGDYRVYTNDGSVVWEDPQFDLTAYQGKTVRLSLIGRTEKIQFHTTSATAYWSDVEIESVNHPDPWR